MALIKCSECGKEISDKAKMCNNCGVPIRGIKKNKHVNGKHCIMLVIVIFIVAIVGYILVNNNNKTSRKFTGEYKEFIYCEEDGYYLNKDNKTCQKMEKVSPINKYRKICPEGYDYEVNDESGDSCVRVVDIKDAIIYKMPIYEIVKEKELPGVTCQSRAGGTSEKEMCSQGESYAEKLLSNEHDEFYYESGKIKWNSLGYPAECNAINITKENIVITKCTVTDVKNINRYGSDELYVATLRTGGDTYSVMWGNIYQDNYTYKTGVGTTWEEAIKVPLDWYNSH